MNNSPRYRYTQRPIIRVRTNERITAATVRLLDADGTQIGVLSRIDALIKAREAGVDLIEIAPKANPPVAKLIELHRYLYQQTKREAQLKKKTHEVEMKEIRLGPFISDHDLWIRAKKAKAFLEDGDRIRFVVKFTGRQMVKREFGPIVQNRTMLMLANIGEVASTPKFEGRRYVFMVAPVSKGKKHEEEQGQNEKISAQAHPGHGVGETHAPADEQKPPQDGEKPRSKTAGGSTDPSSKS